MSGPGALCRARALHHAQVKKVYSIACMLDSDLIFDMKLEKILLKLVLCWEAWRFVGSRRSVWGPALCVGPWRSVSGPGAASCLA